MMQKDYLNSLSDSLPPPSYPAYLRGKFAGIPRGRLASGVLAALAIFCSPVAFAADFVFDKDHTHLSECYGDGYPARAWTITGYVAPMSGATFDFLTEGVEFGSDRRMTGIFFHRIHDASVKDSVFNVVVDSRSPIRSSFFGIATNASDNLRLTGNSLNLSTQNNDSENPTPHITGTSKQLHLIHVEGSTALTEWVETSPGHMTQVTVEPARGSNDALIEDNHMIVHDFISDGVVATVSSLYLGGTVSGNTLAVEDSQVKRIDGVTASSQTRDGGESQSLKILNNVTRVTNVTFNELRGAYLSGAKNADRLDGNELYVTNPTISAKWSTSKVIAQHLASVSSNSDRNQPYQDVVNGYLEVTGTFKADSEAGDNQSFEFGAAYSMMSGVRNNHVLFKDLTSEVSEKMIQWKTYGGYSQDKGDAVENSVTFDNAQFDGGKTIYGGVARGGSASTNKVEILNGSRISGIVIGAYAAEKATDSNVTVVDSAVSGTLALFNGKNATTTYGSGTLTIKGNSDVTQAVLLPYMTSRADTDSSLSSYKGTTDTTLLLDGFNGGVQQLGDSLKNAAFDHVRFLNQVWSTEGALLNVDGSTSFKTSSLEDHALSFTNADDATKGGTITLVESTDQIRYLDEDPPVSKEIVASAGTALEFSGTVDFGEKSITYTVQGEHSAEQTTLVGDSRLASAAFVNQSTDLLERVFHGFTLSRDKYGLMTFATAEGSKSDYDLSSPIKVNGWSFLAGVRSVSPTDWGDLTSALFVEYGEGNYRTKNEHLGMNFRTDGDLQYVGAGIAVRLMTPSSLYVEGSVRAGELRSDLDRALMDANGNFYDADTESFYGGLHVGTGFIAQPFSSMKLDSYAKYFFTYTDSDRFTISNFNETYEFESISSHRLRLGTRASWRVANVTFLLGLAGEYEFDGESDMIAANAPERTSDLGGFSAFAEVGLNVRPSASSPWQFDVQVRGWEGQRDAVSGMATINYLF